MHPEYPQVDPAHSHPAQAEPISTRMKDTQQRKETLFLTETAFHGYYLKASDGFCLGNFKSIAEAQAWCNENGYKLHFTVLNQKGTGK